MSHPPLLSDQLFVTRHARYVGHDTDGERLTVGWRKRDNTFTKFRGPALLAWAVARAALEAGDRDARVVLIDRAPDTFTDEETI